MIAEGQEGQSRWLNLLGEVVVASGDGRSAAAGRLLGVMSLQSLPRRLTLDFRDVFSEGFAFDFVRGDVAIAQGIASTNNLQMKGVNAAVLMEGRADIARETQDLRVVVVPEINAGTASVVAGVINPAVGLGSFLAQLILRQPLIRASTQEFHVDGTWADPRVTRVGRFLRSTSLDELPQLINVLKGEMSLVGPRPIVADEARHYGAAIRDYMAVRPGLTGLWQIGGRSDTSYAERVRLDQTYVQRRNLGLDLWVLMRTVVVVLKGRGSY